MSSVQLREIIRIEKSKATRLTDPIAAEEPLEIRIASGDANHRIEKSISITMRTPGNDEELAVGFLLTEGIIHQTNDIEKITANPFDENSITLHLSPESKFDLSKLDRHFYTSSSCGVCGKTSIDAVKTVIPVYADNLSNWNITPELISSLPKKLREAQTVFDATGGLHASALFNKTGELLLLKEDVGRHNALDKLIGASFQKGWLPLNKNLLLLSGRISFELVQKAAMAGIKIILAIGAPSGLAIQLAEESGITLCGFIKTDRFNLYTGSERVNFAE